jgi:hypothetical protein
VSRRRSWSFGCFAALRGRLKVLQRPTKRGMDHRLGATTPRAHTTGAPSRLRVGRRETKKVIVREEGYTYIAALRSPDLRHTTKPEGDTSVTLVTNKNGFTSTTRPRSEVRATAEAP